MRKLTLPEFYQLEPKTGSFRFHVFEKYRALFTGDELDFIPWARIFDDLRKEPGFPVQSKEQWDQVRRNSTLRKLKSNQGAAKQHFMSLWYWLYKHHDDPTTMRILNEAAIELFQTVFEVQKDSSETIESLHRKTYSSDIQNTATSAYRDGRGALQRPVSSGKPKAARVARRKEGRRFLEHGLMENFGQGREFEHPVVTILDIDDLTIINKVHGWEVGNEILDIFERAIKDVCSIHLLQNEYVCGICGDDTFFFAIYSKNVSSMSIVFNEFLQSIVEYDWEALSPLLAVTFSAGWAQREYLESSLSCSQRAEAGMNEAKSTKGKNTLETGPPLKNFSPRHRVFGWS